MCLHCSSRCVMPVTCFTLTSVGALRIVAVTQLQQGNAWLTAIDGQVTVGGAEPTNDVNTRLIECYSTELTLSTAKEQKQVEEEEEDGGCSPFLFCIQKVPINRQPVLSPTDHRHRHIHRRWSAASRDSHSSGNEYFRIFPNQSYTCANSEYSEYF